MAFSTDYLQKQLVLLPEAKRYLVGFSGGLDSHALLNAMAHLELDIEVIAVHINHSIQEEADQWQEHCAQVAADLNIEFLTTKVDANPPKGESPEAWARQKRYDAFLSFMQDGDLLLLAHHQDDQIETFFLQLLRGSGPQGLAAMSLFSTFSNGWIGRPLLQVQRQDLETFAQENKLQWIEDPSNQDSCYDRNYLRHEVLPLIKKRWPGYVGSLSRSISLQSDANQLQIDLAIKDIKDIFDQDGSSLSIRNLLLLSDERIRNLLRYWIKNSGFPLPSAKKLRQIIDTVLTAADDRSPCVEWDGTEIRRYQNRLMIMSPLIKFDPTLSLSWNLKEPLELPMGILTIKKYVGQGFQIDGDLVEIRYRQGGEELQIAGSLHSTTLKKYLQQQGIPSWLRDQVPLIYFEDQLVAVSDLCVMKEFAVENNQEGRMICWKRKSD